VLGEDQVLLHFIVLSLPLLLERVLLALDQAGQKRGRNLPDAGKSDFEAGSESVENGDSQTFFQMVRLFSEI